MIYDDIHPGQENLIPFIAPCAADNSLKSS